MRTTQCKSLHTSLKGNLLGNFGYIMVSQNCIAFNINRAYQLLCELSNYSADIKSHVICFAHKIHIKMVWLILEGELLVSGREPTTAHGTSKTKTWKIWISASSGVSTARACCIAVLCWRRRAYVSCKVLGVRCVWSWIRHHVSRPSKKQDAAFCELRLSFVSWVRHHYGAWTVHKQTTATVLYGQP